MKYRYVIYTFDILTEVKEAEEALNFRGAQGWKVIDVHYFGDHHVRYTMELAEE